MENKKRVMEEMSFFFLSVVVEECFKKKKMKSAQETRFGGNSTHNGYLNVNWCFSRLSCIYLTARHVTLC
jgi:hypothetical protein